MKNNNKKSLFMQRGGLMIEALAMLGLIAVVTPTMYKKSAERVLEVEDINTADTVRSYMSATEAYMAANYRKLIEDMTLDFDENGIPSPKANPLTEVTVTWEDIKSYLPYGFKEGSVLYDYNEPKIAIVRQGTNLTAFALFPAKDNSNVGQERTSRIASLIGSNGGYTKLDNSAHGIGGVWNLKAEDVKTIFGTDSNNEFSLVTASSNVINSSSGAGTVENTKYLQRTKENTGELWRNSMRTDLYMGGVESDAKSDPDDRTEDLYSILNINSLIVGAEKDIEGARNGLYIASKLNEEGVETLNPNAYIGGTLTAAYDQLFANKTKMGFGEETVTDETGAVIGKNYRYQVEAATGNVYNVGNLDMAQWKDGQSGHINIGRLSGVDVNSTPAGNFIAGFTNGDEAELSLISPDIFTIATDSRDYSDVDNVIDTHVLIEGTGYKGVQSKTVNSIMAAGKNSLGEDIVPHYSSTQTFPTVVGSNMMVKGLLSAGQLDAQHLRTAGFSIGSENIDDDFKWLEVDKNGITIRDINSTETDTENGNKTTTGMYGNIDKNGFVLRTGEGVLNASVEIDKRRLYSGIAGESVYAGDITVQGATITNKAPFVGTKLTGHDILVGSPQTDGSILIEDTTLATSDTPYRMLFGQGGNVDMIGTNLKIMDQDEKNILTIRGMADAYNRSLETNATDFAGSGSHSTQYNDFINDPDKENDIVYNIATHGNVLFSSMSAHTASNTASRSDDTMHYMAIGADDETAGVNIVETLNADGAVASGNERVLFVDLSSRDDNAYVNTESYSSSSSDTINSYSSGKFSLAASSGTTTDVKMNAGTVYVRKGMVEVAPNPDDISITTDSETGASIGNSLNSATDGSGIIRASRFVANNINLEGETEVVEDLLTADARKAYNGNNSVRYDTYMVNPAYTSVMKDIKLTTRGGARLSDILPDFIAKGIYLANNTYDDGLQKMRFILQPSSKGFEIDASKMVENNKYVNQTTGGLKESAATGGESPTNWASPFCGLVPAPQCPPGYARVVTVNPYRFQIAEAGQLDLADSLGASNSSGYFVSNASNLKKLKRGTYSTGSDKEELEDELKIMTPNYHQLKDFTNKISGNVELSGSMEDGTESSIKGTITINSPIEDGGVGVTISAVGQGDDTISRKDWNTDGPNYNRAGTEELLHNSTYVLSANKDAMLPLMFQQNTWFHSEAIPVVSPDDRNGGDSGGTYIGYDTKDKYVRGWAVLQGFLYHHDTYLNFVCGDNKHCKEMMPIDGPDKINGNDVSAYKSVLWNLFPVAKNSLGAYVNTYCYFDRSGMFGDFEKNSVVDNYNTIDDVGASYQKGDTGRASDDANRKALLRQQLNDPALKYNEIW